MRTLQQAAVDRLRTTLEDDRVHEPTAVPKSPTTPYALVSVTSGAAGNHRGGVHGSRDHRLVVQVVGRTFGECGFVVDATETAFQDHRLQALALDVSPLNSEIASPVIRDPDGGALLTCTLTYTFTAYPTE